MKERKLISLLLMAAMILSCCFWLSGCSETSGGGTLYDENVGPKIICKADDFKKVKGNWYGTDSLVSSQALSVATTNLVVGEIYYFVYTFYLDYTFDEWNDSVYMEYDLQFGMKTWDGLFEGTNAVTFFIEQLEHDDTIKATLDEKGSVRLSKNWDAFVYDPKTDDYISNSTPPAEMDTRAYIAVPFTPKRSGILHIDSIINGYSKAYTPLSDTVPRVMANVMDAPSASTATVSNLSFGLVSRSVYESGGLDTTTNLADISQISLGRNYVVVDFDVTSENGNGGEVYCGIYMHAGKWENVTLEEANTAKFNQNDLYGGEILDFSYSVPSSGTKRIRTVLSFTVLDMCAIDFEFFLYSDNTAVSGTTYDRNYFSDSSISQLTYRVEHSEHKSYVSGYSSMTGNVVIPNYHEGYPVVAIDDSAFANCTELRKVVTGGNVKTIGYNAFENCTGLESILLSSAIEVIHDDAFTGCTSLAEAVFEEPYVWERGGIKSEAYAMYEPHQNAQILVDISPRTYLVRKPLFRLQNTSVGFVDEATYQSGNYEDKISKSLKDSMKLYQTYYLIFDFDMEVLSPPKGSALSLDFSGIADGELVFLNCSNLQYWCYEYYGDSDENSITIQDLSKTHEPERVRLIFKLIPKGNRQITIAFSSYDYITDSSIDVIHRQKEAVFEQFDLDISSSYWGS